MLVAHLQIKNVPDRLHSELRHRAEQSRTTVRDYVLRLIEADQARASAQDWADELAGAEPLGRKVDVAPLIHEGRQERAAQVDGALRGR